LIVGLHGWGRDRHDLTAALSGHAQMRVDLPGFGLSPRPSAPCGAAAYADWLAAALDEHGLAGPAVLVGHSRGGGVAVLCGAPLLRDAGQGRPALGYRMARSARRAHLMPARRFEAMRRSRGSADYNAATGQVIARSWAS
jgi:thioesterase domain-containing protein